ncbi:hypothetical protein RIF29_25133 [Crotalaria pallida]|uniref:RNase H type-1 domain-containing protein n=1 Tax=Crotalaria pallida TaxID=3830 RepID=A0AAN9HZI5_CROPI
MVHDGFIHSGDQVNNVVEWVRDLIIAETKSWNRDLIYSTLSSSEAALITQTPLRRSWSKDSLIWRHTKEGIYTVRSGYICALTSDASQGESSSSHSDDRQLRKKIWAVKSIPRDVQHIWFASSLVVRIVVEDDTSFLHWIDRMLHAANSSESSMIFELMYVIWQRRNEWVFDKRKVDISTILNRAASLAVPAVEDVPKMSCTNLHNSHPGAVVVHVDAARKKNNNTVAGVLVLDQDGKFVAAANSLLQESMDATSAGGFALDGPLNFSWTWV